MENNNDIQKRIDSFLSDHKIRVEGGQVSTEKDMAILLNRIAKSEIDKANYEKGLYFALNAYEFDNSNIYSVFLQGLGFRFTGKYEQALKAFKYYNNHYHDLSSLANIGFCLLELKKNEEALEVFANIVKNISENEEKENKSLMALVYECMGNIYLSREDVLEFDNTDKLKINYKLAVKYYKHSLRLNKVNHMLLNRLAACYYHFDDERKALYCYEEAAKVAPEEENYSVAIRELRNAGIRSEVIEF